ncbi:hypothetical protein Ancab_004699 [Ancistrocladus abbreviatus]
MTTSSKEQLLQLTIPVSCVAVAVGVFSADFLLLLADAVSAFSACSSSQSLMQQIWVLCFVAGDVRSSVVF